MKQRLFWKNQPVPLPDNINKKKQGKLEINKKKK